MELYFYDHLRSYFHPLVPFRVFLAHFILFSGTLNYASAGPVWREKKRRKNKPRTCGHTTTTNHVNEPIHPPTTLNYSGTAVRSTAAIPTNRSTHPPCVTAVQKMTYSSVVDVYPVCTQRPIAEEGVVRAPWVQKKKCEKTCQTLIACLLYTSPSPRDKRQSRMPSSA